VLFVVLLVARFADVGVENWRAVSTSCQLGGSDVATLRKVEARRGDFDLKTLPSRRLRSDRLAQAEFEIGTRGQIGDGERSQIGRQRGWAEAVETLAACQARGGMELCHRD
jgi:hypothetical protein